MLPYGGEEDTDLYKTRVRKELEELILLFTAMKVVFVNSALSTHCLKLPDSIVHRWL